MLTFSFVELSAERAMGHTHDTPAILLVLSFELRETDFDLDSSYRLPPLGLQAHPSVQALQANNSLNRHSILTPSMVSTKTSFASHNIDTSSLWRMLYGLHTKHIKCVYDGSAFSREAFCCLSRSVHGRNPFKLELLAEPLPEAYSARHAVVHSRSQGRHRDT